MGPTAVVCGVMDDVDHRNTGNTLNHNMIISNPAAPLLTEEVSMPKLLADPPDFINKGGGKIHGVSLLRKLGTCSSDHIQEDTESRAVARNRRVLTPVA